MDIIFDTSVIDYGRALAFKSSCFNVKLQVTPLLRNPSHYLKDEKFFKDDTIVIDVVYIFEERGMNNVIRLDFQFIIDFRSYTISINKNGVYGNDDESINKRAGNLIKKNLLSKMFDKLPMSELFMIRGVSSIDYKKVVDCVENINLNELCSRKDIYLLRKHLLDWK